MISALMWTHYFTELSKNTIILTPNRRLSAHLLSIYDNSLNHSSEAPKILPIDVWLMNCWQQLARSTTVMSNSQELLLWQHAIEHSEYAEHILNIEAAAKLAQQAWKFLSQAEKSLNEIQEFANLEVNAFTQWAKHYQTSCITLGLIDSGQMLVQLIQSCSELTLPEKIFLVGFDDLPAQTLSFLKTTHANLVHIEPPQQATAQLIGLDHTSAELQTMLRWVKHLHEQQPTATITCVIPNLEQIWHEVVREMQRLFFPEALINSEFSQALINVSGGYALSQTEMIRSALLILKLSPQEIDYQSLSYLLTSPFIKGAVHEYSIRSLLDSMLRDLDEPILSWKIVINKIYEYQQQTKITFPSQLVAMLQQFLEQAKHTPTKASYKAWAEIFNKRLELFGWPGANLSSEQFQQRSRFEKILTELAELKSPVKTVSYHEALYRLQQLLHATLFQKHTANGPIQILGLLEAAGLESDYMWIMGLDNTTWPATASPNPFIPQHLQRHWHLPHSGAEHELQFARKLQQRFMHSCKHIMFSYPLSNGEQELQASTLLKDIPEITIAALNLSDLPLTPAVNFAYFTDPTAPALDSETMIQGGAAIFKNQAACPFKAFATHRLHAEPLAVPQASLSALERGNLVHYVLDNVWKILGTQPKLLAVDAQRLTQIVQQAIEAALQKVVPYYSKKLKPQFRKLEAQRLYTLIMTWLEFEKQRPDFKVIAQEQPYETQFENLKINMRVDRIDEVADGHKIMIDYKTGQVSTQALLEERLQEPQLPLYCTTNQDIHAVSFAEIRSDKISFKGFSEFATKISGIKEKSPQEWQELMTQWQMQITTLAAEFNAGHATVTPYGDACTHCDLLSLCRLQEIEE